MCSDSFSAGSILASYDWADEMVRRKQCVISGFQSRIEKDVFEILLKGTQPIITVLARGMYKKNPAEFPQSAIDNGRLLLVSPFPDTVKRPDRRLAQIRNQFIIDNADEVVFAHIQEGGMLQQLVIPENKPVIILN